MTEQLLTTIVQSLLIYICIGLALGASLGALVAHENHMPVLKGMIRGGATGALWIGLLIASLTAVIGSL